MAGTLRRFCVTLCVPLALALTGCIAQFQTSQPYTPGEGVNLQVGQVKVRNLMVIADASGQGVLSASAVSYADDTLTAVSGTPHKADGSPGSALVVSSTGLPLAMPANTLFILTDSPLRVAVTSPDLKPGLSSMGMATPPWVTENRPNYAPPRFSVPIVPDFPGPPDPDAPPAPQAAPAPGQQTAPAPAGPPLPAEAGAPAPVQQQSAPLYGGLVGPVGSQNEKDQLSQIVGGPATSAQQLLLGPVARGSDVQVTPVPGADGGQNGGGHP